MPDHFYLIGTVLFAVCIVASFLYGKRRANDANDLKSLKLKNKIEGEYDKKEQKFNRNLSARRAIIRGYLQKKLKSPLPHKGPTKSMP